MAQIYCIQADDGDVWYTDDENIAISYAIKGVIVLKSEVNWQVCEAKLVNRED